ncbi:hypothetical protein ADIS_0854 [Lunatimonas lonarensis]|uniref:Uncharacterized protein n=1 Tax=Lunatimonas lonarensis TaxID=1232681 RepID=R7ZWZ6_9BACT|nr:hypothetical protein ADIS_0854 [Lunatimonas lonarensis]
MLKMGIISQKQGQFQNIPVYVSASPCDWSGFDLNLFNEFSQKSPKYWFKKRV